jgi:hypothetical protein
MNTLRPSAHAAGATMHPAQIMDAVNVMSRASIAWAAYAIRPAAASLLCHDIADCVRDAMAGLDEADDAVQPLLARVRSGIGIPVRCVPIKRSWGGRSRLCVTCDILARAAFLPRLRGWRCLPSRKWIAALSGCARTCSRPVS